MRKSTIVILILLILSFVAGCSANKIEKEAFKEALKKAEELKKLSLAEKFDRLTNSTTVLESRALLGVPEYTVQGKLGDVDITVYIWRDSEGNEVGAAFAGAKLVEKLDKEQIQYFKNNK